MATISENLITISNIKSDIQQAILSKGGSAGDNFAAYAGAIRSLPTGSGAFDFGDETGAFGEYMSHLKNYEFPSTYSKYTSLNNSFKETPFESFEIDSLDNCESMYGTFRDCPNLKTVTLPATAPRLTNLGYCFSGCRNLETLTLPSLGNVSLNGTFEACENLSSVKVVANQVTDTNYCINTSGIETLDFSEVVATNIDWVAFQSDSLVTVKFNIVRGDGTTYAFGHCPNLENFEVNSLPNSDLCSGWELETSTKLTVQSLNNIIAALPNTYDGRQCSLGAINLAKLSDAEIAVATAKGWTLI